MSFYIEKTKNKTYSEKLALTSIRTSTRAVGRAMYGYQRRLNIITRRKAARAETITRMGLGSVSFGLFEDKIST